MDQKVKYSKVCHANEVVKSLYRVRHYLLLRNGLSYNSSKSDTVHEQLVLNKDCLVVMFKLYHDMQNHLGVGRTVKTFQDRFY